MLAGQRKGGQCQIKISSRSSSSSAPSHQHLHQIPSAAVLFLEGQQQHGGTRRCLGGHSAKLSSVRYSPSFPSSHHHHHRQQQQHYHRLSALILQQLRSFLLLRFVKRAPSAAAAAVISIYIIGVVQSPLPRLLPPLPTVSHPSASSVSSSPPPPFSFSS